MVVMRKILAERDAEIQRCLALCDALLEQIKEFDLGSDADFIKLLDSYCSAIIEVKEDAKPLMQFYEASIRLHAERWNTVYLPLREAIFRCWDNLTAEQKATRSAWRKVAEGFEGCEDMVAAFVKHYAEEVRKKREAEIEQNRSDRIGLIILGIFIAIVTGVAIAAFCAK